MFILYNFFSWLKATQFRVKSFYLYLVYNELKIRAPVFRRRLAFFLFKAELF